MLCGFIFVEFIAIDKCHRNKGNKFTGQDCHIVNTLTGLSTLLFISNIYLMKIVYIAEKEELQALIKESIHEEIEAFLKGLNQKTIPERLSLVEAALYLGVSKSTLYKFTHTRKIPYYKFGRAALFITKELDEWIKQN